MKELESPGALRQRLTRKYKLEQQEHVIEGRHLNLYAVADVDALIEELLAKGEEHPDVRDERLPYWAELWPSAIALARHILLEAPSRWQVPPSVLEIGCGLGLPALAAGLRGGQVVLSDYLPEPLELARLNWLENFGTEPVCRLMDWRHPFPELAADLLLASDVAYEARAYKPLLQAFRLLLRPGGRILLSEPSRSFTQPFLETLPREGFQVSTFDYPLTWKGAEYQIRVREICASA